MLGQAARRARLDIAEQANLERDSFVEHILREVAQLHHFAVLRNGDVIDQSRPVSDAMRAAVLDGLPDRLFAESFAGMNGDAEILALNIVKSVDMLFGRIAALFAGEIEPDNSPVAEIDGEFRHFERNVHIAHRTNEQSRRNSKVFAAALQTLQHSGDYLLMA